MDIRLIEFITYTLYMALLVFLAISFKPTIYTILILGVYVFYTTWHILSWGDCFNLTDATQLAFTFIYTLCCIGVYKLVHYIYTKKPEYRYTLPILYFGSVRGWFYLFGCKSTFILISGANPLLY